MRSIQQRGKMNALRKNRVPHGTKLGKALAWSARLICWLLIAGTPVIGACSSGRLSGDFGTEKASPTTLATRSGGGEAAPVATKLGKAEPTSTAKAKGTLALTDAALKNGKYELPDVGAFQLQDGRYERTTQVDGGTGGSKGGERSTVKLTVGFAADAFGDLNNDNVADAAVIVWQNFGGTGSFYALVAVINRDGTAQQVASTPLGDRVKVDSLSIAGGRIVANLVVQGPNDPLCCPTVPVTRTFRLVGNTLEQS